MNLYIFGKSTNGEGFTNLYNKKRQQLSYILVHAKKFGNLCRS